jgi:hypothetical protein
MVSEYSRIEVQATMERNTAERTTIPAIMIVCENCGFIAQHALQPLGVWPHSEAELVARMESTSHKGIESLRKMT